MIAALLLAAVTALPQAVVGEEVVWRSTSATPTFHPALQAAPIAADGENYVVTWSEFEAGLSHAYAGRLDARGRLTQIGVRTAGAADAATIVPFGGRYLAAWLEPEPGNWLAQLVAGALDRDFQLIAARSFGLIEGLPIVRANAAHAFITAGRQLLEIDRDATRTNTYVSADRIDDVAVWGNEAGFVAQSLDSAKCTGFFCRGTVYLNTYTLSFTWLYRFVDARGSKFNTGALPLGASATAGMAGDHYLIAYVDPRDGLVKATDGHYGYLQLGQGPSLAAMPNVQPQVAWDGQVWLVVWTGGSGVEAAVVNR